MNQVQADLRRLKRDTAYFEAHYKDLLEQYPKQWVAILDQRVVGASSDYERLLDDLEVKGVPMERAVFKHLTNKEEVWLLHS